MVMTGDDEATSLPQNIKKLLGTMVQQTHQLPQHKNRQKIVLLNSSALYIDFMIAGAATTKASSSWLY